MKETKIEKLILDLSNRWDCSPQEAVDRLNSMNESEINKLINSMTKKFKNGGFIDCLRAGGNIRKCKCGKTIKAQEGVSGLYTGPVREGEYRPRTKISNVPEYFEEESAEFGVPITGYTLPKGSKYQAVFKFKGSDEIGGTIPYGFLGQEIVYDDGAEKLYNSLEKSRQNWLNNPRGLEETLKKYKFHTDFKKYQEGGMIEDEGPVAGRIPRSSMFDAAREFMPDVDRRFVRQAYSTAKKQGRAAGNTGTYLRQDARDRVIEKFRNYADNSPVNRPTPMPQLPVLEDVVIEGEPIVMDSGFTKLDSSIPTVQKMDRFGGNFNSAFAAARRSGLGEFEWNGKRYNTDLDKGTPTPTIGKTFNGKTTGGSVAPMASTDLFYNAGARAKEWVKENQPIRSALRALWDPHPEPLNTYDRKGAAQQMVRDYLNENSPRAKAKLEK